ncbi:Gem-associated protein [Ooceraea biroi]|uniref:Gem-associated protein n=1 Tax=Ooceraea biroi TaxID=2015173 RepID=A0A026WZX8_OOCBI|nr:Gem-associated protein [Ooceraea biroi]
MNETTLPPSPNWYLSNVLACSKRGTVAWGGKNYIVVAKRREGSDILQYTLLKDFPKSKISSLAFCSKISDPDGSDCPELLICGGDDDKVKVYNVDTSDVVVEFNFSDGKPIVAVDWSPKDDNLAYAINSEGFLAYCNVQYKTVKKISLGKLTPTCLACCPHDANLVAIGSKSGLVYIIQKETILYKMRGHDKEVVSLSWCPSEMNVLNGDKRDLLLASGAKDRFVYIWRAGRDGRYETVINLPYQPVTGSFQHRNKFVVETWIAVCWAEPKLLLTSSLCGEVLSWELSKNKSKPIHQLFHTHHNSRGVFCIVTAPKNDNATTDNWRTDSELTIWTLGQDRWVICCRKQNNEPATSAIIEYKIPTQGGYVYCMEACPIDTSRIAFGVGDMILRLWNSSEPHTAAFDVTMHWQKIKGKIRALSWMPNEESVIAFGTGEGRVGVFDAIGTNKPPVLFRQYHRNTVYKLEWAQLGSEHFLFSCAEGELVAYKKSAPQDEPTSIIKKECTEFSWKSDLCLAVALENGSITFYDQKLNKCSCTIHILRNIVNCLAWHPESTSTDEWTSPFANYLAVASDSQSIMILDMSELIKKLEATKDLPGEEGDETNGRNNQEEDCKLYKIVAKLDGHSEKVVCLAWSPHLSGLLVSGGYDNTAQVWNVEKQELLGTFTGHDGPVLSCMWSPLKPQLIITGSVDFTLRVWDYTMPTQAPRRPCDIKSAKKKHKQHKSQKKAMKTRTDNSETHNNSIKESQPTNGVNDHSAEPTKSDNSQVSTSLKDAKKKERKYFTKYNSLLNNSTSVLDLIKNNIRSNQEQSEADDNNVKISLFSEQTEFSKYFAMESTEHRARGNTNVAIEMDIWSGNLRETLMTAVKNYRLNDFLVSLAPNLSMKLWREICEAYAQQLVMEGNVEKAVSYLLGIHKIYEAVQTFVDAKMHKEAYALARCKLDADDPVLEATLKSWAEHVFANGQLEQAAYCYVQLEQFEKAAQALARRKNVYCLELASELAFLSGDEGYGTSLVVDAMTRALVNSDWSRARSLIAQVRKVQYLIVHIDAHEAIMSTYQEQTKLDAVRMWLKGNEEPGVLHALVEKYNVSYNEALRNNANTNAALKNETDSTMMYLNTSYQIAIAATCDTRETRLHHVAKILSDTYEETSAKIAKCEIKVEAAGFFIHILTKLDTKKPMEETSIYAKSEYPVSQSIRAYLCLGLLNWLLDEMDKLSTEEEIQLTQVILDLMDDAINETTLAYQKIICDHKKVEDLHTALLRDMQNDIINDDDYKKVRNDLDKLQLDKKKFTEERVRMPNPMNVFHTACLVADKLRDDVNHLRFLCYLDKLVKAREIKLSEIEENILKKSEDLSHKT